MAPVLCYWEVRGVTEPIRFLLNHVGVEFEDRLYKIITPQKYETDRSEWLNDKFSLGLPFPNLPYYIDGDTKLTQSVTILRHLARKHGLDATSEEEEQVLDVIEQQLRDLLINLVQLSYDSSMEDKRDEFLNNLTEKLHELESWMEGKEWFGGDRLTYVDFLAYETLDHHRLFEDTCLNQFPKLNAFINQFEALPNINAYMNSGRFKRWPLYGPIAKWGYYTD